MTQLEFTAGFDHLPTVEDLEKQRTAEFEVRRDAIDDSYTDFVMQDYQQGDEKSGLFFEEGFFLAVQAYEDEYGVEISPEERERIREYIESNWKAVQEHGFDEPIESIRYVRVSKEPGAFSEQVRIPEDIALEVGLVFREECGGSEFLTFREATTEEWWDRVNRAIGLTATRSSEQGEINSVEVVT